MKGLEGKSVLKRGMAVEHVHSTMLVCLRMQAASQARKRVLNRLIVAGLSSKLSYIGIVAISVTLEN